jgi:hypothetical protein
MGEDKSARVKHPLAPKRSVTLPPIRLMNLALKTEENHVTRDGALTLNPASYQRKSLENPREFLLNLD